MLKKYSVLISVLIFLFLSSFWPLPTNAKIDSSWSFGLLSGLSLGYSQSAESLCEGEFMCMGIYGSIPVLLVFDHRINERWSVRGGIGADYYLCDDSCDAEDYEFDLYFEDMPRILPALQIDGLYHLSRQEHAFNPYIGFGLRVPLINPQIVLGNDLKIGKKVFITTEVVASALLAADVKIEAHLGFLVRY